MSVARSKEMWTKDQWNSLSLCYYRALKMSLHSLLYGIPSQLKLNKSCSMEMKKPISVTRFKTDIDQELVNWYTWCDGLVQRFVMPSENCQGTMANATYVTIRRCLESWSIVSTHPIVDGSWSPPDHGMVKTKTLSLKYMGYLMQVMPHVRKQEKVLPDT